MSHRKTPTKAVLKQEAELKAQRKKDRREERYRRIERGTVE